MCVVDTQDTKLEQPCTQEGIASLVRDDLKRGPLAKPVHETQKRVQHHLASVGENGFRFDERLELKFFDETKWKNEVAIKCGVDPCRDRLERSVLLTL